MRRRIFKRYGKRLVNGDGDWLFVNTHGEYEYRNPDSVYVHRWDSFRSEADARDWLDRCVAKVQQPNWTLYVAASPVPEEQP